MDGSFILGDLAGVPDLLGLVVPIRVSPLVSAWVLVAVPLRGRSRGSPGR